MNVLTFDIETIPQQTPLSSAQQDEFNKRELQLLKRKFPDPQIYGLTDYSDEQKEEVRGLAMATTPYLGEVVCIGLYKAVTDPSTGEVREGGKALVGDEKTILLDFWKQLKDYKGLFVSFNGIEFDVPFIVKRSLHYGIKPTNNNFMDLKRFSRWPHFDVRAVMGDFDRFAIGNLDLVCDFVGVHSPKHGDIKADGVEGAYKEGRVDLIGTYCLADVKSTYEVYKLLKDYTFDINKKNQ